LKLYIIYKNINVYFLSIIQIKKLKCLKELAIHVKNYEKERLLNKQVKERLSQLGLSPRTLKNKQRQLARD
jgi:hypothetical protein